MKIEPIHGSEAIKGHAYDPETQTLYLQFHSREEPYRFSPVTADEHQAFLKSESKGRHFHAHLRGREAKQ
jgi:hypothetical protein